LLKCRGINGKAATVRAMLAARAQQACGVLGVWALCWAWLFPTMPGSGDPCGVVSTLCAADTATSSIDSQSQPQTQSKPTSVASHTQSQSRPRPSSVASHWFLATTQSKSQLQSRAGVGTVRVLCAATVASLASSAAVLCASMTLVILCHLCGIMECGKYFKKITSVGDVVRDPFSGSIHQALCFSLIRLHPSGSIHQALSIRLSVLPFTFT